MSISGLHIGLVAGLGFLVLRWAWAWAGRAPLRWPAPKAGVVGGLLCALVYSAFAGFALPTQRALIMLGVVATALLWGRHPSPSNTLAAALLLVLLADPLAVMSAGFWLSFAAVAVIMFSLAGRHSQPRGWRQGVRLQWLIALGLAPFTLWLFQQASLVAPLANGIAIPVVALLVVPLTLLGSLALPLIPTLGAWLLVAAAKLLGLLWPVLQWLASLPFALWAPPAPAPAALAAALVGVGLLLAPRGWPGRWLGGVWLLPLLWPTGSPIATGAARFTLLDSGQGLAAVVQTRHHVLVYDSGPRYGEQADAGERVVVPYLRAQGVTQVDLLLLSHGDSDHIGGAASIVGALPVQRLLGSEVERVAGRAVEPCGAGETWIWDQVTFRVLHPSPDRFESGNDASCVLQVATAGARLLIPGDLGFAGETALVNAHGAGLRSDILVAPHHGSQSSSGAAFAAAVAPRFVLFAAGHQNRFQFPRPAVVARYQAAGSVPLQTAESGAISFELGAQAVTLTPARYRDAAGRYWHRR
jgi:competence protein ComEC